MSDYIRREDAKTYFAQKLNERSKYSEYEHGIYNAMEYLDEIPAADVRENVHGDWKHIGGDEWCCEFCGHVITTEGSWEHPLDVGKCFCENCGADMRGEKDD